jgi:hypothetical protein
MTAGKDKRQNGAIANVRLTTGGAGCHYDTVLISEDAGMPSDVEFAALRDMLPNNVGEGTPQGSPGNGEVDSIVPEDITSGYLSNEVAILSNALRYIQYLEGRK